MAWFVSMLRTASMAFSALPSWMNPMRPLMTTTPMMTPASTRCSSRAVIAPAASIDQHIVELRKEAHEG